MRGSRGLLFRRHRLLHLLEGDVDDVVLLLAEGVHVDFTDQRDIDRGGIRHRSAG